MSKQSEAKERQLYVPKAIPQTCANCRHMSFDLDYPAWMIKEARNEIYGDEHKIETGHRCKIGDFAVKKMGTCNEWTGKPQEVTP